MKRLILIGFILCAIAWSQTRASGVETASAKIVSELKKGYAKRTSQDVVLADFITVNVPHSTFGDYLTGTLTDAFKRDPSVKVFDQEKVNAVLGERNAQFNGGRYDYTMLNEISQAVFKSTHDTPTAYCFGQIKEEGDDIRITVKMIDAETGDAIAASTVTFPSDETTDRLLGKPVRERKPLKPDTVVVIKERIVEKPVEKPAEQPAKQKDSNTIEVYTAKTIDVYKATPLDEKAQHGFKTEGFVVAVKKCSLSAGELVLELLVTNENDVTKDFMFERCRFIDENGNALNSERLTLGVKNGGSVVRTDLISHTPVKASITFSGVSPKLTSVKAVQVRAQGREFVLRDLPIDKE